MHTEVCRIETPAQFDVALEKAAALLRRGELVAVPTETVYGLAANAMDEAAVRRLYAVKGRPAVNPIIVHVSSLPMARQSARAWPREASALAAAFWPGPLTLVLPKARTLPEVVTAGGDTVGLRWPGHPFMRELIRVCGFPIAAPSANRANELSPTTAEHVAAALGGKIPLIVDAGPASVGIESTVLDLTSQPPRLLRAGMISPRQIVNVLGREISMHSQTEAVLKSPGLLRKHYSPRAKLVVLHWENDAALSRAVERLGFPVERVNIIAHEKIPATLPFGRIAIIPHDPEAYARALYSELHVCDQLGAGLIIVEELPPGEDWEGIRDRLNRASATA